MKTVFCNISFLILGCLGFAYGQATKEEVQTTVTRARTFLEQQQTESGSIQDSTNSLFNVWETILVVDALLEAHQSPDSISKKALNWLKSCENKNGLICHNDLCKESFCVETSAMYMNLLIRRFMKEQLYKQLAVLADLQEENGSWNVVNPDVTSNTDFPSVTGFVVCSFAKTKFPQGDRKKALEYIASRQLEDGSWGMWWEYYNCPGYAMWQCIPALRTDTTYNSSGQKAIQYVLSTQLENGSWNQQESEGTNRISPELQTAFMLSALKGESSPACKEAYRKGIEFLVLQQLPNGGWNGGFFPIPKESYKKQEYLITTALALNCLTTYQREFK